MNAIRQIQDGLRLQVRGPFTDADVQSIYALSGIRRDELPATLPDPLVCRPPVAHIYLHGRTTCQCRGQAIDR